jgi:peptidoglycan hydrolase-like protein with peptidoglycan-binding domain
MHLSKYARSIVITLAIAVLSASHPAYSQECEAYPWNARKSVRGGCKSSGARCTVLENARRLGTCKTKFPLNPYERECECVARFPLRRSATGEDVKLVQAKLAITADGIFGERTQAAVRAFQRDHGLRQDGVVGRETATALGVVAGSDF